MLRKQLDKDLQDLAGLTGVLTHLFNPVLWREAAYHPTS